MAVYDLVDIHFIRPSWIMIARKGDQTCAYYLCVYVHIKLHFTIHTKQRYYRYSGIVWIVVVCVVAQTKWDHLNDKGKKGEEVEEEALYLFSFLLKAILWCTCLPTYHTQYTPHVCTYPYSLLHITMLSILCTYLFSSGLNLFRSQSPMMISVNSGRRRNREKSRTELHKYKHVHIFKEAKMRWWW